MIIGEVVLLSLFSVELAGSTVADNGRAHLLCYKFIHRHGTLIPRSASKLTNGHPTP